MAPNEILDYITHLLPRCAQNDESGVVKIFPAGAYQGALRLPGPPACRSGDGAEFLLRRGPARKNKYFHYKSNQCCSRMRTKTTARLHAYVDAHMRSSFSAHAHVITIKERTSKVYIPIFSVIYSYEAHPHILSDPLLTHFSPRMNTF